MRIAQNLYSQWIIIVCNSDGAKKSCKNNVLDKNWHGNCINIGMNAELFLWLIEN